MSLTVGSMFSGIGGLDLGLERAGMTVRWQAEVDPYCCRVLAKHWPNVPNLGDVTAIDWSDVEPVDVICGGYPCQPFSVAGKRRGEDDPRHLWPHVLDAVRVLRPRFLLCENVPGHLALGFDRVLADLAAIGFDAEWSLVSACSMGAPHLRERLFFVAYPTSQGLEGRAISEAARTVQRNVSRGRSGTVRSWPRQPGVDRAGDGFPNWVDRLRGLGNAVVPQVAEHVGRLIVEAS